MIGFKTGCFIYISLNGFLCNSVFNFIRKDVLEGANPTLKRMPWSYEKEVRLIIEVKKALIEKDCLFAKVELSDKIRNKLKKRIYCSTKYDINLDVDDYNDYANSGIKINQSKLSGQIDWQLK